MDFFMNYTCQQLLKSRTIYYPQHSCEAEVKNNRIVMHKGSFVFHRVANVKDNRISAQTIPTHLFILTTICSRENDSSMVLRSLIYSALLIIHNSIDGIQNTLHTQVFGCFVIH